MQPGDMIDRKFLTHAITDGFRNKIINGNFQVNQRVVTGTVVLAAGQYGHDRWKAGSSGCTYTFATSGGVTTLTITAGSLQQVIEGIDLQSGTHTLSWAGTAQGKIGAGSYSESGVTGSVTGGSNLAIEFGTGTLSQVQFEPGSVATQFEHRPYGIELGLCQRYGVPLPPTLLGQCFGASFAAVYTDLGTPMRATPSLSTTAGYTVSTSVGSGVACSVTLSSLVGGTRLQLDVSGASGLTAGHATIMVTPVGAFLSAEL